jgi:hypothetical protein
VKGVGGWEEKEEERVEERGSAGRPQGKGVPGNT